MRTLSKESVLELCVALARDHGIKNPLTVLVFAARVVKYEAVDHTGAMLAAMDAAGGSLVRWYGASGVARTVDETVSLFEDALFKVQLGG